MRPTEYDAMFQLEDSYWWFEGSMRFILSVLYATPARETGRILDAGCGTGGLLRRLEHRKAWGVEIASEGIRFCQQRGLDNILQASVTELPFRPSSFDVVLSIDVLVHQWVPDDVGALREIRRVLIPGGFVLLQVAAHRALWSAHDVATLTRHRYTRDELGEKVERAGLEVVRITYRNTLLSPLAVLVKLLRRARANTATRSDLVVLPRLVNRGLFLLLAFENYVARRVNLPIGVSIFCIARKPLSRNQPEVPVPRP
ncbi:MAG: class I SAM-dependent methyltransferase [Acidobacteria bacterium]|nr:MAG: class I SAM-dependent methyltransferase [Acidobacteriota bacterium]